MLIISGGAISYYVYTQYRPSGLFYVFTHGNIFDLGAGSGAGMNLFNIAGGEIFYTSSGSVGYSLSLLSLSSGLAIGADGITFFWSAKDGNGYTHVISGRIGWGSLAVAAIIVVAAATVKLWGPKAAIAAAKIGLGTLVKNVFNWLFG